MAHALRRKRYAAPIGHFATSALVEESIRALSLDGAGSQQSQLHEVAAVQRQLRDLFRMDGLSERGVRTLHLHLRHLAGHVDFGSHRGGLENQVHGADLSDFETDVAVLGGLETGRGRGDGVSSDGQPGSGIATLRIHHHGAVQARTLVLNRHGCACQDGLGGIGDGTGNRPDGLSLSKPAK